MIKATFGVICRASKGNTTSNKNTQIANLIYLWEVISITCYFCTSYCVRCPTRTCTQLDLFTLIIISIASSSFSDSQLRLRRRPGRSRLRALNDKTAARFSQSTRSESRDALDDQETAPEPPCAGRQYYRQSPSEVIPGRAIQTVVSSSSPKPTWWSLLPNRTVRLPLALLPSLLRFWCYFSLCSSSFWLYFLF